MMMFFAKSIFPFQEYYAVQSIISIMPLGLEKHLSSTIISILYITKCLPWIKMMCNPKSFQTNKQTRFCVVGFSLSNQQKQFQINIHSHIQGEHHIMTFYTYNTTSCTNNILNCMR